MTAMTTPTALPSEQLHQKISELVDIGGTQVLHAGRHAPEPAAIDFYEELLRDIKEAFPHVHIHAFSPPEFVEFVAVFDIEGFPRTDPKKSHSCRTTSGSPSSKRS